MPSRVVNKTGSVTLIPVSFDNEVGSYHFQISNGGENITSTNYTELNNAFADSNSSSSARLYLARNKNNTRTSQAYFDFDKSLVNEIPSNAVITSISCKVRYTLSNYNTYITAISMQLYSGTTAKGSAITTREQYQAGGKLYTVTPGTWTRAELQNIRFYISATHNASNNGAYIYFFGADVTINYSYQATEYEITTTVQSGSATLSPTSQYVESGLTGIVTINNLIDISTFSLTDNGNNIVSELVNTSGNIYTYTIENISEDHTLIARTVPAYNVIVRDNSTNITSLTPISQSSTRVSQGSNFDIRFIPANINYIDIYDNDSLVDKNSIEIKSTIIEDSIILNPSTYVGGNGTVSNQNNALTDISSTTYAQLQLGSSRNMEYSFNVSSIPSNATILSISCQAKGTVTRTSNAATVQLYSNGVAKGTRTYLPYNSDVEIVDIDCGTWTREELENISIILVSTYTGNNTYYARLYGVNLTIEYEYEGDTYYIYTVTNVQADRTIRFEDKTKYNITSSSSLTGVSVSPSSTQVYEGNDITLDLVGISNIQGIILKDNDDDVTSSIVAPNIYEITEQVSGADYGFTLNGNEYYESTNKNVGDSISLARINFEFGSSSEITIQYINYAEATYDYGIFGYLDTALSTSAEADSNAFKKCNNSIDNSSNPQVIVYQIPAGSHFIDIKYYKDTYTSSNNDSLQWKILDNQSSGSNNYTYTITNVVGNHILTILEAPHHTITASFDPDFIGVTISPSGSNKIYQNGYIDFTITSTETTKPGIKLLLDDIIDVTSNISGNNYRFNDDGSDHTLKIVEQPKYTISGTGYNGITVSISTNPVYHGSNTTITINNVTDISEITIYDNNKAITGRFELEESSYVYILTNITTNHTITIGPHVTYTITSTNNTETPINIIPTGNRTVDAGDSFTIGVMTNDVSHVKVLDNSENTSSELVYVSAQTDQTISSNPNELVEAPNGFESSHPATYAFYPSTNTQRYARINVPLGSTIYAIFNLTPIELPEFAIINNVSCTVRAYASSRYVTPRTVRLYSGTTAKGSDTTIDYSSSRPTVNLTCGTWTVNELKDIKLRFDATETDDYASNIRFYGATFTVNYTIPEHYEYTLEDISAAHTVIFSEVFVTVFSKASGAWSENSKIYEKRNGNWVQVERDDILTLFDTHKIYIRK